MNTTRAALAVALVALAGLTGCDDKSPPPSAQSTSGSPLGNLADQPTSLPGRSAAAGRSAAQGIAGNQDRAANMANQLGGGGTLTVGGLSFNPPEDWKQVPPPNSMQAATLQIAPDRGQGETVVSFFSNIGGDVRSNIDRWKTQVTDPATGQPAEADITDHNVAGFRTTIVKMQGTYAGMSTGSSKAQPNTAFRAAIIEAPAGKIFIRLTGPIPTVQSAEGRWEQMVLSGSR